MSVVKPLTDTQSRVVIPAHLPARRTRGRRRCISRRRGCSNSKYHSSRRRRSAKEGERSERREVGAIAPTGTTKAHRRYRDHLWTFAVYRSPVDV